MGLMDYMGAFTDSSRRITSSKARSRTRSRISDLEGQGSNKRPRKTPHQGLGLGLGLGSIFHFSAGFVDLRGFVSDCESNSVVRRLNLFPAPSPLKREVQGPQRSNMPKRSPSSVTHVQKMRIDRVVAEERDSKQELEQELENEWVRPVRCYESTSSFEDFESYKRRVAYLQRALGYAQHENRPSSSSAVSAPVDVEERENERKDDVEERENERKDDVEERENERKDKVKLKENPLYKTLYEKTSERNFKLKALELEAELTRAKLEAMQFTSKEIKSESQRQNQVGAEKEQQGEDEKQHEEDEKENRVTAQHDVFTPLSDDEESDVAHALRNINRPEVLVTHNSSNIQITRAILQCLLPNGWLNDEVINLYLELLKEREKREPKKYLKCHFFNTFFYKKLYNLKYDYKAVRRWTTQKKIGYSLNDCDKIFVPIHKEIHWCLAIIDMRAKKFQYLDSLNGTDGHVLQVLARYIADEVKDKTGQELDVSTWEQEIVEDIPGQENGWDCGMFMIKYADFHSRDLPLIFGQEHMPYFRKRTAKEILRLRAE